MRSRCPLCGNPVHGEAHSTGNDPVHAWHCPNCGRFTVPDDVQRRLPALSGVDRARLTAILLARGSQDARGAPLYASDLPVT